MNHYSAASQCLQVGGDKAAEESARGNYRVSVDHFEKQTGYDLLSNVPESVHRVIEATSR